MSVASFFDPDLPRNEGSFRAVKIIAPEETIVNAKPPSPKTMCTVFVAHEIVHALWKALSLAGPSRSCAGWGKSIHNVSSGWLESGADEGPFVMYHWNSMPGGGAVEGRDGFHQIGRLIALGGLKLPNIETYEQLYPVRFLRQEMRCDGGGTGKNRGGTGVHYESEVQVQADHSFRAEGLHSPSSFGINEGQWGKPGEMTLYPENEEPFHLPKYGVRNFSPLRLEALSPGGGGWGNPLERDPEAVLEDVRNGIVSRQAAIEIYGVQLSECGSRVNTEATQIQRKTWSEKSLS